MSRVMERAATAAELSQVRTMLTDRAKESPIARLSLEARMSDLEKHLQAIPDDGIQRARVELTFRGAPVHATQGVEARFAAGALDKYDKAVALAAASMSQKVKNDGRIPGRESNKLFITDRALGSFGFVLEEIPSEMSGPDSQHELVFEKKSLVCRAAEQTDAILLACEGSDEELAEAASQVDRRTIVAIRDFLNEIGQHDACFTMRTDDRDVGFSDVASVRSAAERLDEKNISESDTEVIGFLWFLPAKRTFEIQPEIGGDVIYGKIDPDMTDEQIGEMNILLGKKATFTLHVTKVGHVRVATRYRLLRWTKPPN